LNQANPYKKILSNIYKKIFKLIHNNKLMKRKNTQINSHSKKNQIEKRYEYNSYIAQVKDIDNKSAEKNGINKLNHLNTNLS